MPATDTPDSTRRASGMLSNFIAHLHKSDYRGEKYARPKRLDNWDTWCQDSCHRHNVKPPNHSA